MTDDEIDFSDIPPVSAEMFAKGIVRKGLKPMVTKQQKHESIRLGVSHNFGHCGKRDIDCCPFRVALDVRPERFCRWISRAENSC